VGDAAGLLHEYAVNLSSSRLGTPSGAQTQPPLTRLRTSSDLATRSGTVTHLALHPGGRHLVTLSGDGDVAAVDLKLLITAKWFGRVKAGMGAGPVKVAVSPGALELGWRDSLGGASLH